MTTTSLVPISQEDKIAAVSGFQDRSLPIEQACVWEAFEKSQGHGVWGRYAWCEDDTKVAFITLYKYAVRGVHYLWAKWGPTWVKEATPEREAALRADLLREIKKRDKSVVFVRLHAIYQHPDLVMPLQTISYDRTVVIDTSGKTEEAILAAMPKSGKRSIRSGLKKGKAEGITFHEDTANATDVIDEYYAVMEETAERDGFRPHPKAYYMSLLTTLGPKHARIFSMRDADGAILCRGSARRPNTAPPPRPVDACANPRSWTSWPPSSSPATACANSTSWAHTPRAAPISTASASTRAPLRRTSPTSPADGICPSKRTPIAP